VTSQVEAKPSGKTELRRTVPFLQAQGTGKYLFAVDNLSLANGNAPSTELLRLISRSLDLASIQSDFEAGLAEVIVEEQYDVCLNHVFSHPFWELLREGLGHKQLYAYMLETRHYLYAAVSRMSPGAASCSRDPRLTKILTDHVIEEADHAKYFEAALAEVGVSPQIVAVTRPLPTTLEWIHLMRSLASRDSLAGALCSGLMEYSAVDRELVVNWHSMLVSAELLPPGAAEAMLDHIRLDMELEHGNNWREALRAAAPIGAKRLTDALNAVCAVAEMMVRWLDSILVGTTGLLAMSPEIMVDPGSHEAASVDVVFNGCPVWPAEVYHAVSHGTATEKVDAVVAWAYTLGVRDFGSDPPVIFDHASALARRLARSPVQVSTVAGLLDQIRPWLRAIDGHGLWQTMLDEPSIHLVEGWILENYFYLAAAPHHVGAALAACPDDAVRSHLLHHFEEEAYHSEILASGLQETSCVIDVRACRPLPTTISFVGFLESLAASNWIAYCIALGYLQLTLDPRASRHGEFYESIVKGCPETRPLVNAMRAHDLIDQELEHEADMFGLLNSLISRWQVDGATLQQAAMVAPLAWGFLDGIRQHYSRGEMSIAQRIGWHA
jgi:pyrroloquinoline quinone (PQQ) biosynthesis protein C